MSSSCSRMCARRASLVQYIWLWYRDALFSHNIYSTLSNNALQQDQKSRPPSIRLEDVSCINISATNPVQLKPPLGLSSPVKRQHQSIPKEKGSENPIFEKHVRKKKSILRDDPHLCVYPQIHKAKPHPLCTAFVFQNSNEPKAAFSAFNNSISQQNSSTTTTAHSSQNKSNGKFKKRRGTPSFPSGFTFPNLVIRKSTELSLRAQQKIVQQKCLRMKEAISCAHDLNSHEIVSIANL